MHRPVRTVLALAVALAAWMVAMPAWAESRAPLCDDRAATMFAPAPQLQAPEASIDMSDTPDDCLSSFLDDGIAHQGGDTPRAISAGPDATILREIPGIVPTTCVGLALAPALSFALPLGICSRLERPPR